MELTDAEREEFNRLANLTLDPALWDESDLPILRANRAEYERQQALERGNAHPPVTDDDSLDDADSDPHPHRTGGRRASITPR